MSPFMASIFPMSPYNIQLRRIGIILEKITFFFFKSRTWPLSHILKRISKYFKLTSLSRMKVCMQCKMILKASVTLLLTGLRQ